MSIHYLLYNNTNDEDVTLFKFRDRESAFAFIEEMDVNDFILSDIIDQSGCVSGFEPEDYETRIMELEDK